MKLYEVRMTMTVCVTVEVAAENPEDAEKKALEKTGCDEAYYLSKYDSVWEREVVEVNECEVNEKDQKTLVDRGIDYVREHLEPEDLSVIRAQVDRSYRYNMSPSSCVTDHSKVIDLLAEFWEVEEGGETDADCWWDPHIDFDDILKKL